MKDQLIQFIKELQELPYSPKLRVYKVFRVSGKITEKHIKNVWISDKDQLKGNHIVDFLYDLIMSNRLDSPLFKVHEEVDKEILFRFERRLAFDNPVPRINIDGYLFEMPDLSKYRDKDYKVGNRSITVRAETRKKYTNVLRVVIRLLHNQGEYSRKQLKEFLKPYKASSHILRAILHLDIINQSHGSKLFRLNKLAIKQSDFKALCQQCEKFYAQTVVKARENHVAPSQHTKLVTEQPKQNLFDKSEVPDVKLKVYSFNGIIKGEEANILTRAYDSDGALDVLMKYHPDFQWLTCAITSSNNH